VILLWIRYGLTNQRLFEERANVFVPVVKCHTEQQKRVGNEMFVNLFYGPACTDQISIGGNTDNLLRVQYGFLIVIKTPHSIKTDSLSVLFLMKTCVLISIKRGCYVKRSGCL
jgi:hypothetical protein